MKKVFVGMSGGVDSSVSAALLQKAGYDVTGVFIRVWQPDWFECTWKEDRLDAMRVCAKLGIPFRDLDLSETYKKEVVDYMISEYKRGRTPNPDVMCNRSVKFGGFFDWAMKAGADFVATGHYAQIEHCTIENLLKIENCKLKISADNNKEQTYFLWTLSQKQITHTLFPVGHLTKPEVRKLAEKFGLPTATKKDSQGLCFIGKINVTDFLQHYVPKKLGVVHSVSGNPIGTHEGAIFYTIGQRHGFTITDKHADDKPLFVVSKNIEANTITVTDNYQETPERFGIREVTLTQTNWISHMPSVDVTYYCRTRYREKLVPCRIECLEKNTARVAFETPKLDIAAGQSLVVYSKIGECLGGGILA